MVRTLHFTARGIGSMPGQGTKIPQASRCGPPPPRTQTFSPLLLNIKTNACIYMKHREHVANF